MISYNRLIYEKDYTISTSQVSSWKWQRRWNKAWKRAERKAKRYYYEDISSSNPWNYFYEELKELKK